MADDTGHNELEKFRTNECMVKAYEKNEKAENEKWKIVLEPALVGAMAAITLGQTTLQNFYLRTACNVDLQLPRNVCDSGVGPAFQSAEKDSQELIANFNVSRSFVGALISTIVLLFAGPWSDCSGRRKPLLIMPLLGMSIMTFSVILMISIPGLSIVQVLYIVQIPMSLGGNFGLLLAAAFSYIGDVCHAEGRDVTRVMGTHRAVIQVAHVAGIFGGPLLYRHFGFYGVFPIVLSLQVAALIYVILRVKDTNINRDNKVSPLNWRLPMNALKCLVRERDGNRRKIVMLMLFVTLGDRMLLAGTLIILTVLKRRLKLSDEMVGALSCLSFLLATSSLIAARSTVAAFLSKIYSVMGALEQAFQSIYNPLYSLLYANTVKVAPDAWLIPGLLIAFFQIQFYLLARKLSKSSVANKADVAECEELNKCEKPLTELETEVDLHLSGPSPKWTFTKVDLHLSEAPPKMTFKEMDFQESGPSEKWMFRIIDKHAHPSRPPSISPLSHPSNILFLPKETGNALVTVLELRVSISGGDHLLLGGSHARLPLDSLQRE
ncbi:Solute carrier family 46 member 3 [Eumeta japonica]|uniref:Solute carrier family 46 member 3 n=1 Tax=Eumeta variegata TaxID=151549 RepID=A0A4C1UIR5_EUMVA|nr:Solute carrier family 46 member 3 [Eumeta japonica]